MNMLNVIINFLDQSTMDKMNVNEYKKYQGMMITLVISLSAAVSCIVTIITIMLFFIGSKIG